MSFFLGSPAIFVRPAAPDVLFGRMSDRHWVVFRSVPGGWAARIPFEGNTYRLAVAPEGAAALAGCPVGPCWYCGHDVAGAQAGVPAYCCEGHEEMWRTWHAAPVDAFGVKVASLRTCDALMVPHICGSVPAGVSLRTFGWARQRASLEERKRVGKAPRSLDAPRSAAR